ncbi:MAG: CoA-binding protein [Nitrospinae bacterium CG11_big_fil_rev_8_21_14_0_20_56_8]|nr:MAG: CoA-binding protein [Nitrospinae bacterium CG11_big_fil_rev_8_21_14_0_20_56_8]
MHKSGVGEFPYYVGINSLAELATKDDRVVVLNILGKESSTVTPVSHEYSGGNVVFGTGPGKSGLSLPTKIGKIPVYNSIKEGMLAGHKFNSVVVYLPPSGVKDGVAEAVRANPDLKKVIVLTEKIAVKDSRIMRAICQANGVDLFGGNCLGVADSWNHVRIGGALGGSHPEESLIKGSVAIFSNSGNFTTTIAVYLSTAGWGTTTSVSSGKDVYIQYGPKEFLYALDNDDRSKAAILYCEPGGYYEHEIQSNKPLVACVVGRWKARLTKACGHAGSLAGSGDDAFAKEKWFMDYFGVDGIYTPQKPVFSRKGALVTNIAHIPEALTRVMELNGVKSDFEPKGSLSLKCWFGSNQGLGLPKELDLPVVEAISPYNEQIAALEKHVGAQFRRDTMKDASGASMMDPVTQVSKLHNMSILDLSQKSLEANLVFALTRQHPDAYGEQLANLVLNGYVNQHGQPTLAAAEAAREAGSSPNIVTASAVGIVGKKSVQKAMDAAQALLELFQYEKVQDPQQKVDISAPLKAAEKYKDVLLTSGDEACAGKMMECLKKAGSSVFISFVEAFAKQEKMHPTVDALFAAVWVTLGWTSLKGKKITKSTLVRLPWYSRIYSTIVGVTAPAERHQKDGFCGVKLESLVTQSFTKTAFMALLGREPSENELFEFKVLLGLIITNGPGTISAQGAKGAVSADGPEQPDRVQVNKGFMGFLTHTGFAHGGNGYEAAAFLVQQFKDTALKSADDKKHGINLEEIALNYAKQYKAYKDQQKVIGNLEYDKIPCVNHPIFKGKEVNVDPREEFVNKLFQEKNLPNVFLDFYHSLVEGLFKAKASKNVYCVNIDAVIAVILLKMVWKDYRAGKLGENEIETASFATFLFGRMIGCAAEIDDHTNRGRNMDTRTAASKCVFVA